MQIPSLSSESSSDVASGRVPTPNVRRERANYVCTNAKEIIMNVPSRKIRTGVLAVASCAIVSFSGLVGANPSSSTDVKPSVERSAILRRDVDTSSTSMEETRNARAAARQGKLALAGEDYTANALARCEPHAGAEKVACEARVMGFGNSSGSVSEGGLLRWVETVVVPPDAGKVTIAPRTDETLVLVPVPR
jgi:hypothetical protein